MAKKSFTDFLRDGLAFASQKRFLSIQVAFYAAAALVFFLALATVAAGFLRKVFSGNLTEAIASIEGVIVFLVLVVLVLAIVFFLASLWLTLFFISASKKFLSKAKREPSWSEECAAAATGRFLPFLAASIVIGVVTGLGAIFFTLLSFVPILAVLSPLLSSVYALFFSLAFLYAPFFLALQGRGVWDSLSQSFEAFKKNPVRVLLLLLASQIAGIAAVLVALVPAAIAFLLGVSVLLAGGVGAASLVTAAVFFLLGGLILAVGISFGNLAAIGILASAFLENYGAKKQPTSTRYLRDL